MKNDGLEVIIRPHQTAADEFGYEEGTPRKFVLESGPMEEKMECTLKTIVDERFEVVLEWSYQFDFGEAEGLLLSLYFDGHPAGCVVFKARTATPLEQHEIGSLVVDHVVRLVEGKYKISGFKFGGWDKRLEEPSPLFEKELTDLGTIIVMVQRSMRLWREGAGVDKPLWHMSPATIENYVKAANDSRSNHVGWVEPCRDDAKTVRRPIEEWTYVPITDGPLGKTYTFEFRCYPEHRPEGPKEPSSPAESLSSVEQSVPNTPVPVQRGTPRKMHKRNFSAPVLINEVPETRQKRRLSTVAHQRRLSLATPATEGSDALLDDYEDDLIKRLHLKKRLAEEKKRAAEALGKAAEAGMELVELELEEMDYQSRKKRRTSSMTRPVLSDENDE